MSDLFNIYEDKINSTFNRIKKIIDTMPNLSKGISLLNKKIKPNLLSVTLTQI